MMNQEAIVRQLSGLFAPDFADQNLELVDLMARYQNGRLMISVLAQRQEGEITLAECSLLCRRLKNLLEEKNVIDGDYTLEVASPGLDRPLKEKKDFLRKINQTAVFFLNDLVEGKCQWQGQIAGVDDHQVLVQAAGKTIQIPLDKINKAQLVI